MAQPANVITQNILFDRLEEMRSYGGERLTFGISNKILAKFIEHAINLKKEINDAKNAFKKYKWPTIDVTRKSVEEAAASIIKIYEIYKQNG